MNALQIPNGRRVTVGAYARAWRLVARLPAGTPITGWDAFETTAGRVRADMIMGMLHRISRHDRTIRTCSIARLIALKHRAVRRGAIVLHCCWCGSQLPATAGYLDQHRRFCGTRCRNSYHGG